LEWLSRWILRRAGWRATGVRPRLPRFVLIVAPHTSNWDFPVSLLAGWGIGLLRDYPHGFLMKDSLDRWPFRPVMRRLGGIPVVRTHPEHSVARTAAAFTGKERFLLALAPEGTRKPTRYWRSGFWHIAREAGVPVVPVALDFGRKELRIGEAVQLTGDAGDDMAAFREFFEGARGFTAEYASPIELAPEKREG
jgi:1-acyl-sn-glycerol-3-phosphate acyltransferase